MRVLAKSTLRDFWEKNPRSQEALEDWFAIAEAADWSCTHDVRQTFPSGVDFIGDNRIIFDIRHNEFRLIVHVAYEFRRVLVKFVGTHKDYDRTDPETV